MTVTATRVLSADRRGSSWPVLVETEDGVRFVKLHGAAQGAGPLVAELIVAAIAEALDLRVPARSLVMLPPGIASDDRNGELADLLIRSAGLNLGFAYLDRAWNLSAADTARISADDAAAIVWLDRFVMNFDRTARNPNLLWWRESLWLIDHGAALHFQYNWGAVTEQSPRAPLVVPGHLLEQHAAALGGWDHAFAARITRGVLESAVADVPDEFLVQLEHGGGSVPPPAGAALAQALSRRRAAYVAFLWKRLVAPRPFV